MFFEQTGPKWRHLATMNGSMFGENLTEQIGVNTSYQL